MSPFVGRLVDKGWSRAPRSLWFRILGGFLALLSLNHWMLIAFVIPVFTDLGAAPPVAVLATSIIGPTQVVGRLVLMRLDERNTNWRTLMLCLTGILVGVVALRLAVSCLASVRRKR
ncbi:hypothetical protein OAN307_c26120 [Octadecabacter antarcticus 307]|uniref:Uncharacterized protein n=1 Tax=Octadecabacter antarcticus 307 TaxID=391626 RepID=M9R6D0_9RHOB|nr:hypothetical protein [Octadecabacter antarcticus]AGI68204.1 hypothetical protein OAN307_c26120 [Octadecabacter antarcticus 307]